MTRVARLLAALALVCASAAHAHKPSDSYLTITQSAEGFSGRWDIALRDLDFAIGLDADGDGAITWGEVRARHAVIAAYAGARLRLSADDRDCRVSIGAQMLEGHTDGTYSVLPLAIDCGAPALQLGVGYTLFADIDPQHRGLLNLRAQGVARTAVLDPQAPLTWLLSATLARRLGKLDEAQGFIEIAAALAPDYPETALEAGVIAMLQGREDAAKASWESAVELDDGGLTADIARGYLAQLAEPAEAPGAR